MESSVTTSVRQWPAAVIALCCAAGVGAHDRPLVLELFTSEGCSSCPPAEAAIGQLSARADVVALAYHVDYWDDQGWRDPFDRHAYTQRQQQIAKFDHVPVSQVPPDAVTASGSGLDPDITVANANVQAPRVARARGLNVSAVRDLIARHTDSRQLGFLGERTVNVLDLNLALDRLART